MQVVLMYHDVYHDDPLESGFCRERDFLYKMKSQEFEKQVRTIADYLKENNLTKESVVFTFDDGGSSFYTIIAPILERYGFKGVFFVSTNYIGHNTFLTAEQIQELSNRDHIIGSHAHTHEHLYTLSDNQIYNEWRTSTEILSRIIGKEVEYASIPNGDVSKKVLEKMNYLGIKNIFTSVPTTSIRSFKDSSIIGRYVVLGDYSTENVLKIISSKSHRTTLLVRYYSISVIKKILGSRYVQIKNALLKK